jgi:membrane-bound lytic murein transglycosylase D
LEKFKLNIRLLLFFCFALILVILPHSSKSQSDTIPYSFTNEFNKNLRELSELYCWTDLNFYPGKVQFNSDVDLMTDFQNLQLPIFKAYSKQAELYFKFFSELPLARKEKLVRFYSLHEKEFETAFLKENLPLELKYLAPALSTMNPHANGKGKRAGVWQLSHFQAILNGLQINKLIDERYVLEISTEAAVRQIKQNLIQFESLDLAVAAYISGNTKVRNAVQQAKLNDKNVEEFLPESFLQLKAIFQAMAVFLNTNALKEKGNLAEVKIDSHTVKINRQLHFNQLSSVLNISENELKHLNPKYKFSIVPGDKIPLEVLLPAGKWDDFVLYQDSIYNAFDSTLFQMVTQKIVYPPSPNRQYTREPVKDLEIEGKTKIKYRLKTGDVLGIIAENYDVRVADLKYWNNIYNERKIQAGKNLDIFVDDDKAEYYLSLAGAHENSQKTVSASSINQKSVASKVAEDLSSTKKIEHTVKSGESPYMIAKKYNGVSPDQILEWNNIDDARKIQIGQKLIVYLLK